VTTTGIENRNLTEAGEQLTEKMKVWRKSRNDWQTKSEFSRNSETNHTKVYYQSIIKHPVFLPKSRFFAG
jgi:hypothetical protein